MVRYAIWNFITGIGQYPIFDMQHDQRGLGGEGISRWDVIGAPARADPTERGEIRKGGEPSGGRNVQIAWKPSPLFRMIHH